MAPSIADAWSNRAHGTSKSNIELIQAQLSITEAGMATTEAHLIMPKVEMATLSQAHARTHTGIIIFDRCRAAYHRRCFTCQTITTLNFNFNSDDSMSDVWKTNS